MTEPDTSSASSDLSWPLWVALVLVGVLAVLAPAMIVATAPHVAPARHKAVVQQPRRVVPPAELPPVEPVNFQELSPDEAREYNASIPFVDGPISAARSFHLSGSDDDRERALDCLATAALYEAGDDTTGQKAVAQVVLNRVRHPAFPNSVCGVVFQGADRASGCQFTFTCDGSLARSYSDAAWERARTVARQALNGAVDKGVGNATHYHTDWVVPYWSASLDKIAEVHSHLFFRWTGWWGTTPAFAMHYAGSEPRIGEIAALFDAHKTDGELADANAGTVDAATVADAALPSSLPADPDVFLVKLDPTFDPATLPALADRACGQRNYCKFMAWKGDAPAALPIGIDVIRSMAFSYLRDHKRHFDKALWNCDLYPRSDESQCMNRAARPKPKPEADFKLEALPGSMPADGPQPLKGVRRKTGTLTPAQPDTASDS